MFTEAVYANPPGLDKILLPIMYVTVKTVQYHLYLN